MVRLLVEELALTSYLEITSGRATVTKKGKAKLTAFKANLSKEEIKALEI